MSQEWLFTPKYPLGIRNTFRTGFQQIQSNAYYGMKISLVKKYGLRQLIRKIRVIKRVIKCF